MSAVLADAIAEATARQARKDANACLHCGRPLQADAEWQATIEGAAQSMCGAACASAAQAIADAGFAAYYACRTGFAPPACALDPDAGVPAAGAAFEADPRAILAGAAEFTVDGVRCPACVWLIERRLAGLAGVRAAQLDPAGGRLSVRWDPTACNLEAILTSLRAIGFSAWPSFDGGSGAHLERSRKTLLRQLSVAGLSTLQVAMVALPAWLSGVVDQEVKTGDGAADTLDWAGLLFTLPAVLYSARPFFGGAWRGLRRGALNIDTALALGIGGAFGGSCAALLWGGEAYFGSVSLFVFLLLGGRYLELAARRDAAGALERLQRGLPATALRLRGDPLARDTDLVPAGALRPGDLVLVQAGQAAPADGIIHEGETVLDLTLLGGESRTRQRGPGATLPGGAANVGQAIVMRIIARADDSTLALLVRLAERAAQGKPILARRAGRVAGWFMGGLLALAALVFCAWLPIDAARGWQAALAVLMIASPCALSLASPSALAAAGDRLLRRGVLALRAHTLETLDRATHVVFDKTGTLTQGRPVLRQALPVGALGVDECLRIAAALEADNPHPLAAPIRAAAAELDRIGEQFAGELDEQLETAAAVQAERVRFVIGQGVEGYVGERPYRLGSATWVEGLAGGLARAAVPAGTTSVWLGNADGYLARFDLSDELRPDALDVVERLRAAGKTVLLLSGDEQMATQSVAAQLGIAGAMGGRQPQEKLNVVRRLQREGAVVAMVGDGVNDAAVLSGADVSFAMAGAADGRPGAELAQLHADGVLLGDGLAPLADAADTARRALAVIRQNLAWVTLYNVAAIPPAAAGLLQPWMAGAAMAVSSALVVLNALRLRHD